MRKMGFLLLTREKEEWAQSTLVCLGEKGSGKEYRDNCLVEIALTGLRASKRAYKRQVS